MQFSRHKDSLMDWAYRNGMTARISRRDNGRVIRVILEPAPSRADRAAELIDKLTGEDPDGDHQRVEEILVRLAAPQVREAYERLAGPNGDGTGRAAWWAFA